MLGALAAVEPESLETAGVLLEAMAVASDNVEELSPSSQVNMKLLSAKGNVKKNVVKWSNDNQAHTLKNLFVHIFSSQMFTDPLCRP